MKAILILVLVSTSILMAETVSRPRTIWDNTAATKWDHAYPVGNGRLGAMPHGQFPTEKILINEETIWENKGEMKANEDSFKHLEVIRELEAKGEYIKADRYFETHIQDGKRPNSYQLVGWLNLEYQNTAKIEKTYRELDLNTGIATTRYSLADGNQITQQVIGSDDDVIAILITAQKSISLNVSIDGATTENGDLVLSKRASGDFGTQFVSRVRAKAIQPTVATESSLTINTATSITLYLSVATDFNRSDPDKKLADGWQKKALDDLNRLKDTSPDGVRKKAIATHQKYFQRVDVDFGKTANEILSLPTGKRLARIKQGKHDDPDLIETYFQFGRYLLIACSRPGDFPANLQGLWNPHMKAPWKSDYHLNINLQMNYWLADTTNLSELHQPLFDLIRQYQPRGREMAKRMGMKGWCMGHATDIWGYAKPMSTKARWGGSFFSGQWLTFHILDYYRFNRDQQILADNWDILTATTEFTESWLIPGPDGTLMSRPTASPENLFLVKDENGKLQTAALSAGVTFDQFMIMQVFNNYLEAADVLGKSKDPYVQHIKAILPNVYQPCIGEDGRLLEWRLPFQENEPGHRHMSHVIGAFPGNQINLDNDPKMRSAVLKTIEGRLSHGGAATGWSRAWTIGMFARLCDADEAYENLHAILVRSTLPNLWDSHPPFQIDGNFGASAAVAEMLVHSHNNEIKLLPALPTKQWPTGHMRGLRARGDYTIDIEWKDGQLTKATIHAGPNASPSINVVYQGKSVTISTPAGKKTELTKSSF